MGCNPCCCLKLKDGAVTIGIWSLIYSICQIAIFVWQFSVLAQCQHVTMAQSNLQCDYYCPCVGASSARTSAIIEGIFGWQMAAIKYERDRAANTLLPNYNTYGRYDIPTYYESYWQSPEERYYTGLFVIQIVCLIVSFFLLFASLMLIYGVHTWSRCLILPWLIAMCASILSSLAYCIMWWAGDVRDYWLLLTILEFMSVLINSYCFLVVAVFHRQMLVELQHYESKRKYDRFGQRETSQHTVETEEFEDIQKDQRQQPPGYSQQQYQQRYWEEFRDPAQDSAIKMPSKEQHRPIYPQPLPEQSLRPEFRSRSAMEAQSVPSVFEDFSTVPRQAQRRRSSKRHKSSCRHCDNHYVKCHQHRHHTCHHHHEPKVDLGRSHRRRTSGTRKVSSSSEYSTNGVYSETESDWIPASEKQYRSIEKRPSKRQPLQQRRREPSLDRIKADLKERTRRSAGIQTDEDKIARTPYELSRRTPHQQGFTIPQHIVIPPPNISGQDTTAERKYKINSEITISYDPRKQPRPTSTSSSQRHYANLRPLDQEPVLAVTSNV